MHGFPQNRRLGAKVALLILAAALIAARPGTVLALGDPWPISVSVEGEVRRPGIYNLPHGATISSLLLAAGGTTENADFGGAALYRVSARETQRLKLAQAIDNISTAMKAGDADALRPTLEFLQNLHPAGRVHAQITFPRLMKNSPEDLALEEGDLLRITPKTSFVTVAGAVRNPSADVTFTAGKPFKEYIRRAGGFTENADKTQVWLLRSNGTAALLTPGLLHWNPAASRWEISALTDAIPEIGPGDTVVVFETPPPGLSRNVKRLLQEALVIALESAGTAGIPPGFSAAAPEPPAAAHTTVSP